MTVLQENSTHKAVLEGYKISMYMKGLPMDGKDDNGNQLFSDETINAYPHWFKDEFLYSIPKEDEECLFAIFERLDEDNRINRAEANAEMN